MKKKLQVFISSTYEDMKEERQEAVEAILAAGHIPAGMELFASENKKQWDVIKRWIRESDVFLILLGGRYGSVESATQKSYIHLEFDYATTKKKPIVSIVISPSYLDKKIKMDIYNAELPIQIKDPRYVELKKKVQSKMSDEYSDIGGVASAVSRIFSNNSKQFEKCTGWVSGKDFHDYEYTVKKRYSGIVSASIGLNRDEEFRSIRDRATNEMYIIGAGMSKLSKYALNSIERQLKQADINLYMLDPFFLESNRDYAILLEDFFNISRFAENVRLSYDTLLEFCAKKNSDKANTHRITLSVYKTIPTMSLVIIDPRKKDGEMVVEYFTYKSGEERPLFRIMKQREKGLFESIYSQALKFTSSTRRVIE